MCIRDRFIITTSPAARDDQAATDDAGDGTIAALAHRRARPPRVRLGAVDLDRRQRTNAIIAAHHPHLVIDDDGAGTPARAAHRRDRPPPPFGQHPTVSGGSVDFSVSPREDHAVLHQPILEALLPEVVRTKQGLEALANRVLSTLLCSFGKNSKFTILTFALYT